MKKTNLEYRMYGLVPYNISPIQQGIQFGHAVVEYANKYFRTPEYQKFSTKDKTFIILNGGTSNDGKRSFYGVPKHTGSMEEHASFVEKLGVKTARFYEPDLNYMLSAVVFLVDERVWNKEKYPMFSVNMQLMATWMSLKIGMHFRTTMEIKKF
jgi:hypothetical protein